MTGHSTYEILRHFADSWGLVAMAACYLCFVLWPFQRRLTQHHADAAHMIFQEDDGDD